MGRLKGGLFAVEFLKLVAPTRFSASPRPQSKGGGDYALNSACWATSPGALCGRAIELELELGREYLINDPVQRTPGIDNRSILISHGAGPPPWMKLKMPPPRNFALARFYSISLRSICRTGSILRCSHPPSSASCFPDSAGGGRAAACWSCSLVCIHTVHRPIHIDIAGYVSLHIGRGRLSTVYDNSNAVSAHGLATS